MSDRLATCAVRAHTRKLPPKKCGLDNEVHRALRDELAVEKAAAEWADEFPDVCSAEFIATGGLVI